MKKLTDYKDEEAIELWADLLDPVVAIFGDKEIVGLVRSGKPKLTIAQEVLKRYKKEAAQIITTIDPTPLDGLNIVGRLIDILNEVGTNPTVAAFFASQAEAQKQGKYSGSAMANTEDNHDTSSST